MKNKVIIFMIAMTFMASCKKYEETPLQGLKKNNIYDPLDKNGDYARQVLSDLYTSLPDGFNRVKADGDGSAGDFLDAGSDDALPSRLNKVVEYFSNGRLNSTNNPDDNWANAYRAIRSANDFLANVDVVPVDANAPNTIKYWKAEARFIRAMNYFEMIKRYGGVPLIGDQVLSPDSDLQIPRSTFAECVNYLISECDAIKGLLRTEPVADSDLGRITRGCAYALKARVLLYAASPLYNGGGIAADPVKKALAGYPAYDASRWTTALNAVQDLINLNVYSLTSTFNGVFIARKNTEVILAKQRAKTFDIETNNAPVGYTTPLSNGFTSPTQELVDAFPMANGLSITDPASGYSASNPYVGRDKRLDNTVFYNGMKWLNTRNVETFEGGRDKPGGVAVQTRTGYYLKKYMADFSTATAYATQDHNFIIFRYGEVLLDYAECLNEVGRTADAYAPLIALRTRAGITAGTGANAYGIKTGLSQADMRAFIQNERRIEMAFEEQRFWDIRRWKTAGQLLNGDLHGNRITRATSGALTYVPYTVATTTFSPKYYIMPIPYAEIVRNRKLVQNEGW
ncbi:RagB/SusD family nutrient uptake outer membrane protein [Pedobacter rhodius]|uniref:RagB/SusD family nutrient uptake outer membrane protein n=1 Tax=Pedobacter rhodius TaxID=3004098 RepID=A0ABT4KTB6_9SPHI|nr:RagB/SusD family nutrient uptake outer membrane protein [Pedobacter sp. SJ11]MCZ4222170.1 RagB/SusD family nutrient uptake outer membrane protein [Pedobacter sp. SJ11]